MHYYFYNTMFLAKLVIHQAIKLILKKWYWHRNKLTEIFVTNLRVQK